MSNARPPEGAHSRSAGPADTPKGAPMGRPADAHPPGPPHANRDPAELPPPMAPGASQAPELPLPHERDESTGTVDPEPRPVIEQAKRDLDAGLVDTDMHATPGLDAERRAGLVPVPKRR